MLDRVVDTRLSQLQDVVARIAAHHGIVGVIGQTDSLVDRGMTSMAMVDLMLALEAEFDITLPPSALTPETFRSIDSLAAMLSVF